MGSDLSIICKDGGLERKNLSLNMHVAKNVVFPEGLWLDDGAKEVA